MGEKIAIRKEAVRAEIVNASGILQEPFMIWVIGKREERADLVSENLG